MASEVGIETMGARFGPAHSDQVSTVHIRSIHRISRMISSMHAYQPHELEKRKKAAGLQFSDADLTTMREHMPATS